MPSRIAVIQFPGSNCEYETLAAISAQGADAELIRWTLSEPAFHRYDGYVLPGGFSYQDRVRAGAIAAKMPILSYLQAANTEQKPILGICNGCQILAECGLVPDWEGSNQLDVTLAPNQANSQSVGFICDWVYVKIKNPQQNRFTSQFEPNTVFPIPINHGEGRFILSDTARSQIDHLSQLVYCTAEGEEISDYPTNPNGSSFNLAGLSNRQGNVFAMMPHPERATFLKQIPTWIQSDWATQKQSATYDNMAPGPWSILLSSFVQLAEKAVA